MFVTYVSLCTVLANADQIVYVLSKEPRCAHSHPRLPLSPSLGVDREEVVFPRLLKLLTKRHDDEVSQCTEVTLPYQTVGRQFVYSVSYAGSPSSSPLDDKLTPSTYFSCS